MTVRREDFPMLTDGAVLLADAFVERLHVDGMVDSNIEYDVADDLHGLAIAAGYGFGRQQELRAIKNYVWRKLGFGDWSAPPAPGEEAHGSPRREPILIGEGPGLIYILRNPALHGVVKIGFTRKTVELRIRQLSQSTSIPMPFELVKAFDSSTPAAHERAIHEELSAHRLPGREFFRVPERAAIAVCQRFVGGEE
ncbi:hypothetical protein [Pseudomonas phage Itty13]|uniref:Bacteriophage T5 Orf172 DNA-binding domain-containing protein n=1 Tax=Pseudomonas phage Itty13 TaxID=2805750 RepID=A0A889IQI5_9CAUD|nr:hypothetical protein PQC19_gp56 [Pseudomonas phage Itty13]QRE00632.1 hypothetical protein [Pseudomonas phage Itty13]